MSLGDSEFQIEPLPRFGAMLRQWRRARDLTQETLGKAACCTGHAIRKIEAEERRPSRELAERLVRALQLGPDDAERFIQAARLGPFAADTSGDGHAADVDPSLQALPFVGRDAVLDPLRQRLGPRAPGQVVLLEGQAGIGKSRLAAELIVAARLRRVPVITSKSVAILSGVAYGALDEWINQAVDQAGAGLVFHPTERAELAVLAPSLAVGHSPLLALSGEHPPLRQLRLFNALRALMQQLSVPHGLLWVVDDLQWLDAASELALLHLAAHVSRTNWLLLLTLRTDALRLEPSISVARAALQSMPETSTIELQPLSRADVDGWRSKTIDAARLDAAFQRCGGNPLLLRAGLSSEGAGATALQRSVQSRLQQLEAPARLVLELAAVLGQPFDARMLASLTREADRSLASLDVLLQRQWLVETDEGGQYAFEHELLRDAVVGEIPIVRRRSLHERLAQWLATLPPPARHAQRARHLEAATLWPETIDAHFKAGQQAEQVFSLRGAIGHYSQALALADAHLASCSPQMRIRLLKRRGIARSVASDVDGAVADLELAIDTVRADDEAPQRQRLLVSLGMIYQRADRYEAGHATLAEALRVAQGLGDARAVARTTYWIGDIAWTLERNAEAQRSFETVMSIVTEHALGPELEALAWHGLGEAAALDARPQLALVRFGHSMTLARRLGDRFLECENLLLTGWLHIGQHGSGRHHEALARFEECLAIAREHDIEWHVAPAHVGISAALSALGRYKEALAGLDGAIAEARALGMPRFEAMALIWLAESQLDQNQPALALDSASRAQALIDASGVLSFANNLRAVSATARMRLGQLDMATELDDLLAHSRAQQLGSTMLRALLARIELSHRLGCLHEAAATATLLEQTAIEHEVPEMALQGQYWQLVAGAGNAGVRQRLEAGHRACGANLRASLRDALARADIATRAGGQGSKRQS